MCCLYWRDINEYNCKPLSHAQVRGFITCREDICMFLKATQSCWYLTQTLLVLVWSQEAPLWPALRCSRLRGLAEPEWSLLWTVLVSDRSLAKRPSTSRPEDHCSITDTQNLSASVGLQLKKGLLLYIKPEVTSALITHADIF